MSTLVHMRNSKLANMHLYWNYVSILLFTIKDTKCTTKILFFATEYKGLFVSICLDIQNVFNEVLVISLAR